MVYYFSGSLPKKLLKFLTSIEDYTPIDVLVSQLDRSSIKQMIEYQNEKKIGKLFIDSGAFSVHTGKAVVNIDEYIEYVNSIDSHIDAIAQVDTIPGVFGQPKSDEDYEESSKKSWDNFLYMYDKLKSPEKLIPVFHFGESFDSLKHMLDWSDKDGNKLTYVGISPANDTHQKVKDSYLQTVYDIIESSSNPYCRTHLFGMTSLPGLSKVPAYSADSISHRLMAGYSRILHPELGVVPLPSRGSSKSKSASHFLLTADDISISKILEYITDLGFTMEEVQSDSMARCAINMYSIQKILKETAYVPGSRIKTKKLFNV